MKPVIEQQDFLVLSASINYQLSGDPVNWPAILALSVGSDDSAEDDLLVDLLAWLGDAYGGDKRRLGPFAVIHPIRSAALYRRASDARILHELAVAMLHDKDEDLTRDRYSPEKWARLEASYRELLDRIGPEWEVERQVSVLARRPNERYYTYLGRILDASESLPELIAVKLADRLDNTLDMTIDIQTAASRYNCFEAIFDIMFAVASPAGNQRLRHPVRGKMNGAKRLYQLFKNVVVLSLLRIRKKDAYDATTMALFESLALASQRQAQSILLHLFLYHITDFAAQRRLLEEARVYCQTESIRRVTGLKHRSRLDGFLTSRFSPEDKVELERRLADLYQDKELMAVGAVALMAIFAGFQYHPDFYIEGISEAGLHEER
ncbi:MAG: hypothetical protein JXB39_13125 [Deltaproteobacteria bacterium]|nr:hypothetical protein [Deltaproteobacteria bacterium]